MFEILLAIIGFALLATFVVVVVLGALAFLGVVSIGALTERVFDILVPSRKTGLGETGIVDQSAVVVRVLDSNDQQTNATIQVAGELWTARSADGQALEPGNQVQVVAVDGMTAVVEVSIAQRAVGPDAPISRTVTPSP